MSSQGAKSPYPSLEIAKNAVPPGEYHILRGDDEPVWIDPFGFTQHSGAPHLEMPGIHFRGFYDYDNNSSSPVSSFLYNKLNDLGKPEVVERLVIARGVGYGEHPEHMGQPPTWYLIGLQIGTFMQETGEIKLIKVPERIKPKNFSLACIVGGPLGGEPLLANPS